MTTSCANRRPAHREPDKLTSSSLTAVSAASHSLVAWGLQAQVGDGEGQVEAQHVHQLRKQAPCRTSGVKAVLCAVQVGCRPTSAQPLAHTAASFRFLTSVVAEQRSQAALGQHCPVLVHRAHKAPRGGLADAHACKQLLQPGLCLMCCLQHDDAVKDKSPLGWLSRGARRHSASIALSSSKVRTEHHLRPG